MNCYFTYLLIDTALIERSHPIHSMKGKPSIKWLRSLYSRSALAVSPVIVDVADCVLSNRTDSMMNAANYGMREMGVSIIDTNLSLDGLLEHLRRFTFFVDESGAEYTLRLADCAVLSALSYVIGKDQWSAMVRPFTRWRVHDREKKLIDLPIATTEIDAQIPLTLSRLQMAQLLQLAEPDLLLANLKIMRPTILTGWSDVDAHRTATDVSDVWRQSGNHDHATLMIFARAVFESRASLLRDPQVSEWLKQSDQPEVRQLIQRRLDQCAFET